FDETATITGIICITNDITDVVIARKKMEAQATMVEDLLLNAPAFISTLTGPNNVYDLINERYQALFGKRKLQGKATLDALPELVGQGFDTILDNVYKTGEPFVGIDIPVIIARDEGLAPELGYFNFSYQPMYNDDKEIYGILIFGYEVTEQVIARNKNLETEHTHTKELEEKVHQRTLELTDANNLLKEVNTDKENRSAELAIANIELQFQNEEKEKRAEELSIANKELLAFSYISSHDLQEPLRKIQTFASLIAEQEYEVLSAKGKDYFYRMEESAKRMQTLIEDLLAYSRTNVTDRNFVKTNLNEIVDEVMNDMSDLLQQKNATLQLLGVCEIDIIPFQMRQVMNNLISNAIKFTTPSVTPNIIIVCKIDTAENFVKEISILSSEKLSAKKQYCRITFKDNGIGFDPQYKDKIFEVFQRLHGKESYAGTGIGLAIVKKIVQNHNGVITAEGKLNEGSTFSIYLPVL
ncbi:MAG: PAS domain-containing protein, partial [Ferruginibacter sp.]|nr:PAS domain-containing protein [Ferruginibacter sp.]